MSSLAVKRAVTTALAGATIASALAAPAVSADSPSVPPPPSSIAAPAGQAYENVRAPDELPTATRQPVANEPSGFDLPSAAIGAATGAGLVMLLLVAAGLVRRGPLARGHGIA